MAENIEQFNMLRDAILAKIVDEETEIQEAHFGEVSEFGGSPVAVIGVSSNQALYSSTASDKMTFGFTIKIYVPIPAKDNMEESERIMGRAYWNVLRIFRSRGVLRDANCDIVEPTPSVWEYEERGDGIYRTSLINLRCTMFISNQQ